ncbi:hypothetical protein [Urbifossiella limnaea]|uniref:Uncharacterized protein n=1 Tax=Urbifossiella limnaea TaxID=2528023 RepID=A0A517XSB1_9BACT|nr:hypothetical protein [Urbifossiella limnaea]QDU20400.1 hypothetical protein ETAA1_23520 [Urbifossiella limnaea]
MVRVGRSLGVFLGTLGTAVALAQPPAPGPVAPATTMPAPAPTRVVLSEVVDPPFRAAVLEVVRRPTVSTRGSGSDLVCSPDLFAWLLDHPDRTAAAWRRLQVPCVEIADAGKGRFSWTDTDGSDLSWQTVGTFPEGRVWYATGKVKPAAVGPTVPLKAVVVVSHPGTAVGGGAARITPTVQAFVQTDSKAAAVALRVLGPTAPKLAQDAAEQLVLFFAGVARYVHAHPDRADELLAPARR